MSTLLVIFLMGGGENGGEILFVEFLLVFCVFFLKFFFVFTVFGTSLLILVEELNEMIMGVLLTVLKLLFIVVVIKRLNDEIVMGGGKIYFFSG